MKIPADPQKPTSFDSFSSYYISDDLEEVEAEIEKQKILETYRRRES